MTDIRLRIGNVIKAPDGELWVVTEVNDRIVQAVAFGSENVLATQRLDDYEREDTCFCGDHPDFQGEPQEDCADCKGTGRLLRKIRGWKHSTVLAPHVKAFITKRALKAFDIDI